MYLYIFLLFWPLISIADKSQSTNITSSPIQILAKNNMTSINYIDGVFSGIGWEKIKEEAKNSHHVLIGEDHFTNEIPLFAHTLMKDSKYDNLLIEVDPHTTEIISKKIRALSSSELKKYTNTFGELFSFYAAEKEFPIIHDAVKADINIFGLDQVVLYSDQLLAHELSKQTKLSQAKDIYSSIENNSKSYFKSFLQDNKKPFYFMTPEFSQQLIELKNLSLSSHENNIINDMQKSVEIYQSGSHSLRIQLMKHNLVKNLDQIVNARNFYKFGAMHTFRGESMLTVFDIGNFVANIADSQYQKSLHVMVIPKSGFQGTPFKGVPSSKVNIKNGPTKILKPFFDVANDSQWSMFDLKPIRQKIESRELSVDSLPLRRVIYGNDFLIIIPDVSASEIM